MRSVAVVLPASMWAMMPMLRTRSSCDGDGTSGEVWVSTRSGAIRCLPAVVGEGLVGLRHAIHVVLALVGPALLVLRVEDLADELVDHLLLTPLARERHEPADGQGAGATRRHLDGDLVVGAADAAGADLERRRDALHGLLQHLDG